MYCTVIKHSRHLRILKKCRKPSPGAHFLYISLVFSNARRVLSLTVQYTVHTLGFFSC